MQEMQAQVSLPSQILVKMHDKAEEDYIKKIKAEEEKKKAFDQLSRKIQQKLERHIDIQPKPTYKDMNQERDHLDQQRNKKIKK